jgi:Arc/MetJ-type ribon-helix-helix transcriptional regulator
MHDNRPADPEVIRQGLAALPESWERQRAEIPAQRHANRAERRAAQRRHRK